MYFCIMNDNFVNTKIAQKYIKIEVSNQKNIDKCVKEVSDADIYMYSTYLHLQVRCDYYVML